MSHKTIYGSQKKLVKKDFWKKIEILFLVIVEGIIYPFTLTMSLQVKQQVILRLSYDKHFMPLASDAEVTQNQQMMTKTHFKKFSALEKKKYDFNGVLFEYSKEHEKARLAVKEINERTLLNNRKITSLREKNIEGNLETVEALIKDTKQRMGRYNQLNAENRMERILLYDPFCKKYHKFMRESNLVHIEDSLYHEVIDTQVREKQEAPQQKTLLKLLNKLPDELLRLVQSYFTYETRAAILVKTYNPVKLFCALKKPALLKVVDHIHDKYSLRNDNHSLWLRMAQLHKSFYKGVFSKECVLSTSELKLYLQYLFVLFHDYQRHQWCFDLYRAIIISKSTFRKSGAKIPLLEKVEPKFHF